MTFRNHFPFALLFLAAPALVNAQENITGPEAAGAAREQSAAEAATYRLHTYPVPSDLRLEASGVCVLPDGRLAVGIRKGEVWILENPLLESDRAADYHWHRFASGLHEPCGLTWHDGALYTSQRSEITRLEDGDGDGVADAYLTVAKGWGVSGNYHEYAYGPAFDAQGNLWLTLNQSMGQGQAVAERYAKDFRWRGWAMVKPKDGPLRPAAAGLRSPMGLGTNLAGDVFVTDQQGNWWGTNPLLHLREGVFFGHAESLRDVRRPESPVKDPGKLPEKITVAEARNLVPGYQPPAVWFPYVKIGMSTTGVRCDRTAGKFGPYAGQMFIGEFTMSFISRVFLEKVRGEYQGACFHFRSGLQCAALNLDFLSDGSLVVGESNRGWNSLGTRSFGLERLVWTGEVPFDIVSMSARPDGFLLRFTRPVDPGAAGRPDAYAMTSYTWEYHSTYGSDEIGLAPVAVNAAEVSADGLEVRLRCEGLREGYVHELHLPGVRDPQAKHLLHPEAYYTLNALPEGEP